MSGSYFTARGAMFDVDSFLRESSLLPYAEVYHRGEPMVVPKGKPKKESGFCVTIGEAKVFGDFGPQIPEALQFLRTEQHELARLARFPGVEELLFIFPCVRPAGTYGCETFPPELVTLAGLCGIGIRISFYSDPAPTDNGANADA